MSPRAMRYVYGPVPSRRRPVKETVVEIDTTDAFPDTPVLDIKPYAPRIDSIPNATVPWWMQRN
jgi:tRNA (Thr-GGU) A37 N-methylase